jgi:methionine-rich copper-binding protein CopC
MMKRRTALATLAASCIPVPAALAQPQGVHVVDSAPKAHARIGRRNSQFFVRFDRPVDHIKSRLAIMQGSRVVETLHPRLESAPEVLFAEAPTLPDGDYVLHWAVVTLQGAQAVEGDIPFRVSDQPPA